MTGQTMSDATKAGYLPAQGSAASTQGDHPGAPQDSMSISEDSAPGGCLSSILHMTLHCWVQCFREDNAEALRTLGV